MVPSDSAQADPHHGQAVNAVRIALGLAFSGALLGVIFGIGFGIVTPAETWIIGACAVVTGGLVALLFLRPDLATGAITAIMSVFFVLYLNVGAIVAYAEFREIVPILPYVTWFFPLVLLHQFTNFGFHKRAISLFVGLGPVPAIAFVAAHLVDPPVVEELGVVVAYLLAYLAFVLFVGYHARHRDAALLRAARVEEAERSAADLRASEERFRLLSQATEDIVWDADLVTGKVWWNHLLRDICGYDPDDPASDTDAWISWIHPEDRDRVVVGFRAMIDSGASKWTSAYRLVCADGRVLEVMARGLMLRDGAGKPARIVGSTSDVTELRALERKLRHAQKLEAVGQMTGGIAHDFNNLLTVILGNSEIIAGLPHADAEIRELAETSRQAAERGATLTGRLLSFARIQALDPVRLDPARLLGDIAALIRRTIDADIEISIHAGADVRIIEVDRGQLENALLNLVINARDAMPEGGRLTIEAANVTLAADDLPHSAELPPGRYVMIAVSDSGQGMSPEIAERAFDPFFTTKEVGRGSGLGLSMVYGFVKQSNGHARIYSEPGEGTTVRLYFPVAAEQEALAPASLTDDGLAGGNERILVVEDDNMVRPFVAAHIRSLGYEVREAATAQEAQEIMDGGWAFDLLFTDVVMPGGMNGRELAEAARRARPGLKVIFTSGYTEDAIVHQGRLERGVSLLGKPYRRDDLARKIRSVLEE